MMSSENEIQGEGTPEVFVGTEISGVTPLNDYFEIESDPMYFLINWYHLPIMDLVTCVNFVPDVSWIARRLGISAANAQEAVDRLFRLGLLKGADSTWSKTLRKIFFKSKESKSAIREYHRQMIRKASEELTKTTPEEFARRSITGMSIAVNPNRLPEAYEKIDQFQKTLAGFLSEGGCTEVYQLNVQLFPLTSPLISEEKK